MLLGRLVGGWGARPLARHQVRVRRWRARLRWRRWWNLFVPSQRERRRRGRRRIRFGRGRRRWGMHLVRLHSAIRRWWWRRRLQQVRTHRSTGSATPSAASDAPGSAQRRFLPLQCAQRQQEHLLAGVIAACPCRHRPEGAKRGDDVAKQLEVAGDSCPLLHGRERKKGVDQPEWPAFVARATSARVSTTR